MPIRRIALIYDDKSRPETTGFYCRRALAESLEVAHFQPGELDRVPRSGFDLYLCVDDGMTYRLPDDLRPSAWWAIDTHLDFDRCLEKALVCDLTFAAQRNGAEALKAAGVAASTWLPLACDPKIHGRREAPKEYDFAFVGHIFPGPRSELLSLLRKRYAAHFVGNAYFEEMARIYSAARVVFNRSLNGDVNMRVFEGLCSGSILTTDALDQNGLGALFRDGVHLATYHDAEDLLDKMDFYLKRDSLRERIGAAGLSEVLRLHTYRHRMEQIVTAAEALPITVAPGAVATSSQNSGHASPYFSHARPELVELVPAEACRVLDVGCGAGRLGEALKAKRKVEVIGIEIDETAAVAASLRLDRVHVGDLESFQVDFESGSFDAIICGDVLEHLRDPAQWLKHSRRWLKPDGRLIASIPNVRHHSVIRSLLRGNWTYESAGLLDQTHLRFFTRREVEKLLFRAGFELESMSYSRGPDDESEIPRMPGEVKIGRLHVAGLPESEAEEFFAYQFILRAFPRPEPDFGVTSIVVVTHNELNYTRLCLDGVLRMTDEPFELIVVDNASTDGTQEYVRSLSNARLIRNEANLGFPAAANQGIAAATGRQILLLNNDVVPTTGWLRRMLLALLRDRDVGLVGPCSNRVGSAQQVDVDYEDLSDLDGFAWDWGKTHEGETVETDRLIGFCLLARKEVFERIGVLDERFGIGCFEDDDLCLRALRAGFRVVIARDAFVHHFGSRTFLGSGADLAAVLRENEVKFRNKWADAARVRRAVPEIIPATFSTPSPPCEAPGPYRAIATPRGGLLLERVEVQLSLCMIVRDNARTLPACLESIRPWVDEMVIVDTGSMDETPLIVEDYGGRLFHFPWCDDFSAARNESLKHARGRWIFWMDSDDVIPPECGRGMRELVIGRDPDPSVLGFVMQVHCPGGGEDGDADVTAVDHVKLFRNRPDLRFDGRIHEQILPAIRRAGGDVAWTDFYVVHAGSDQSAEGQERKRVRDLRILSQELTERPDHPFTLFNLGMTHVDGSNFAEGAEFLHRSISASGQGESHLRKAYALLVYAEMRRGRMEEALEVSRRARKLFPLDIELRFREGVLLHDLGRLEEAAQAYHDALSFQEERHFSSVDRGLTGFKARQNLAVVLSDLNRLDESVHQWRLVVGEMPGYRPGWRGLGETLIRIDPAKADLLSDEMEAHPALRLEAMLLRSRTAFARGEPDKALRWSDAASAEAPDDLEAMRWACRLRFQAGAFTEAEESLRRLLQRTPEDASAWHNLGTLKLRVGSHEEAARFYGESLRLRPDHAATHLQLGYAFKGCGRVSDAVAAWFEAHRLDPNDPTALQELCRLER